MPDLRRRSLRLALGAAVAVVALLEVQGLASTLRSQARLRERVVHAARDAVRSARPRLASLLLPGRPDSWARAAEEVRRTSLAIGCEVFEPTGRRLFASPSAPPAEHWPGERERDALRRGEVVTVGPVVGGSLLSYAAFGSGDGEVLVRLSTPVPELVEDLRERREALANHGIALTLLVVIGALILLPASGPPPPQGALGAYEEAMGRLRDHGQELSREYEAQRRLMEDRIQDKEAMARAGELTAGIAHEVRNGLGTIAGYAKMLEPGSSAGDVADLGRSIAEECATLETVIRRFLDFVKRETLSPAPFDLGRMLSRVVARESRAHPGAEVTLPEPAEAGSLVGDEELLERAFENLIRNAREAAGAEGHVEVAVERQGGALAVTISDDGPGLSAEAREGIRPFFTTKGGGLGLGLPLALKIVRLHGGELSFAAAQPRGLAVTVSLPAPVPAAAGRFGYDG